MSSENLKDYREFFKQALVILAFLGAILFAGLTLILQSDSFQRQVSNSTFAKLIQPIPPNSYTAGVETLLGSLVAVSAVAALASVLILSQKAGGTNLQKGVYRFVCSSLVGATAGLGLSIFLLLTPFNPASGAIELIIFLSTLGLFAFIYVRHREARKQPHTEHATTALASPKPLLREQCKVRVGEWVYYKLDLQQDEALTVVLSSDGFFDAYFFTESSFRTFDKGADASELDGTEEVRRYEVDFVAPRTARYYLVIQNHDKKNIVVDVKAGPAK